MIQSNISSNNQNVFGNSSTHTNIIEPDFQTTDDIGNFSGAVQRCLRNFILGKKIGAGTFSKVCIAKHKLTNQQVAIKIIEKSKIQNEADQVRLNRQIKIMRKVRHPNIVQLYQIIQTNKYIYLVMEYAPRGELFEHIVAHQKLSQFQASKFLLQLTDAIQYLHQLGITHRDLKPQNLLLDHKYNIKVTDFGLSNIYPAGQMLQTACGSPSYACPQMLNGKPYNGLKADIWSIGIVLYAMCFGYLPFDNPNISELYKAIKQGSFDIPQFASPKLSSLLYKILEVDPGRRATINQIRKHPFCQFSIPSKNACNTIPGIIIGLSDIPYETFIQEQMRNELNLNVDNLREEIKKNKHNENTCTYYLILKRSLRQNNQSLTHYYSSKYNTINRYILIEKVKANYDKMLRSKIQIKKFHVIKQQIKKKGQADKQDNKDSSKKKKGYIQNAKDNKKIVHSTQISNKQKYTQRQNQVEDQQNYLESHMKHFAPNNTKKKFNQTSIKKNKINSKSKNKNKCKTKSKSKSKSKNKNTQLQNKLMGQRNKNGHKNFERSVNSNYLQIPQEFDQIPFSKKQNNSRKKDLSDKKISRESLKQKNRVRTFHKQQKPKKRNKSVPQGIKLKF